MSATLNSLRWTDQRFLPHWFHIRILHENWRPMAYPSVRPSSATWFLRQNSSNHDHIWAPIIFPTIPAIRVIIVLVSIMRLPWLTAPTFFGNGLLCFYSCWRLLIRRGCDVGGNMWWAILSFRLALEPTLVCIILSFLSFLTFALAFLAFTFSVKSGVGMAVIFFLCGVALSLLT